MRLEVEIGEAIGIHSQVRASSQKSHDVNSLDAVAGLLIRFTKWRAKANYKLESLIRGC